MVRGKRKWVSVAKALPEPGTQVLKYCYHNGAFWYEVGDILPHDRYVTHWIRLPEPPIPRKER